MSKITTNRPVSGWVAAGPISRPRSRHGRRCRRWTRNGWTGKGHPPGRGRGRGEPWWFQWIWWFWWIWEGWKSQKKTWGAWEITVADFDGRRHDSQRSGEFWGLGWWGSHPEAVNAMGCPSAGDSRPRWDDQGKLRLTVDHVCVVTCGIHGFQRTPAITLSIQATSQVVPVVYTSPSESDLWPRP